MEGIGRNYPAAKGISRAGHHEADPGAWLRVAEVAAELPREGVDLTVQPKRMWDEDYLTGVGENPDEVWVDLWEEWGANMEAD